MFYKYLFPWYYGKMKTVESFKVALYLYISVILTTFGVKQKVQKNKYQKPI